MARKATHETDRLSISRFDQIINVGPAMTRDFRQLGLKTPQDLIGTDPVKLYKKLCNLNQQFYDPCVLDVYMATVDYMDGHAPRQWWDYTTERKSKFADQVQKMRSKYGEVRDVR